MQKLLFVLIFMGLLPAASLGAADSKADYKNGDRLTQPAPVDPASAGYKEINWDALVPKGWDPIQALKGMDLGKLKDTDPRAMDALQKLKDTWDSAPVDSSWRGQRVRIAGFMVPLEQGRQKITEFLLVPYFGACIHMPPPPANQIIHVISAKPLKGFISMSTVWVSGTMDTAHIASPWGASGYKMKADLVVPYTESRR